MSREFILTSLVRLYRFLLSHYPADFREEFGEEMVAVFEEHLEAANGRFALFSLLLHEIGGLLSENVRQWFYTLQARSLLLAYADGGAKTLNNRRQPWRSVLLLAALILLVGLGLNFVTSFTFERPPRVHEIALGDLDGDGDLDAYLNIGSGGGEPYIRPDYILFNDGTGRFNVSQQFAGSWPDRGVTTGDLTSNGLTDILLDIDGGSLVFYINQGENNFQLPRSSSAGGFLSGTAPEPRGVMRMKPELADLNSDGHLDVFAAGCCGRERALRPEGGEHLLPYSLVWLNDGSGNLNSNRQIIGEMGSNAVALGDLDGDGHLDAFLANGRTLTASGQYLINTPNTVWFNNGAGQFQDSGQRLGDTESMAVALGDVNGDGFLDAVVGNRGSDEVWLNDGAGNFSDSGQRLGGDVTEAVYLSDLNGDGYPDLVVDGEKSVWVWMNDGEGQFSREQHINYGLYEAVALGDVTGDGLVDIFVAGVKTYKVWQGDGLGRFIVYDRSSYR